MKIVQTSHTHALIEVTPEFLILLGSHEHPPTTVQLQFAFDLSDLIAETAGAQRPCFCPTPLTSMVKSGLNTVSVNFFEPVTVLPVGWVVEAVPSGGMFSCNWRFKRGCEDFVVAKTLRAHPFALDAFIPKRMVKLPPGNQAISDQQSLIRDTLKMHFGDKVLPVLEVSDLDSFIQVISRLLTSSASLKSAPPVVVSSTRLAEIFGRIAGSYEWLGREAKRNILEGLRDVSGSSTYGGLFEKEQKEGRLQFVPETQVAALNALVIVTWPDASQAVIQRLAARKSLLKKVHLEFPLDSKVSCEILPANYESVVRTRTAFVRRSDLEKATNFSLITDASGNFILIP